MCNFITVNRCSRIDHHTFIDNFTTINPNSHIGDNCIIGANSFINKNVPQNVLIYGSPAKIIKIIII